MGQFYVLCAKSLKEFSTNTGTMGKRDFFYFIIKWISGGFSLLLRAPMVPFSIDTLHTQQSVGFNFFPVPNFNSAADQ